MVSDLLFLNISNERLKLEPRPNPKYQLTELLEPCDFNAPANPDVELWDWLEPEGQETM